jgi:tRNA pseudouridine55 synthase
VVKQSKTLPTKAQIEAVLPKFIGTLNQIPPLFSAKNVNGVRAYELARKNIAFTLKPKQVEVLEFSLKEQLSEHSFTFFIRCSSGTYIRSLVRDLAYELNTVGHMSALTRSSSGQFTLENAVALDVLLQNKLEDYLIKLETVLDGFEVVQLDDKYYDDMINGVKIPFSKEGEFLLYCKKELFGIAHIQEGILKVKVYLRNERKGE